MEKETNNNDLICHLKEHVSCRHFRVKIMEDNLKFFIDLNNCNFNETVAEKWTKKDNSEICCKRENVWYVEKVNSIKYDFNIQYNYIGNISIISNIIQL